MEFSVESDNSNRFGLIVICGEVDIHTSPKLKAEFTKLFERDQYCIVVDMLNTEFFDGGGLGILVWALKQCREAGGTTVVVCTAPHIVKVFNITGMDNVFEIFKKQEEAISFLNNLGQSE